MNRYHTFRDDDVSYTTDIHLLMLAHDLIVSRGKLHTVAVQMERLWDNKEVWFFIMTAQHLRVGLHGWDHSDYSKKPYGEIDVHLRRCKEHWESHVRAYPDAPKISTFYPPWNRVSDDLRKACHAHGLLIDDRWKGNTGVYGFHSWELIEPQRRRKLERALDS